MELVTARDELLEPAVASMFESVKTLFSAPVMKSTGVSICRAYWK